MKNFLSKPAAGHLAASFTILIWGTTMISSKVLLTVLTPAELIFGRFLVALLVLELIPVAHKGFLGWKQELRYFCMGLCGVTLYFFCENTALSYTYASNVSIIVSTAPLFTAILTKIVHPENRLSPRFFLGFVLAIIGIIVLCYNGAAILHLNPIGDLLTLGGAMVWSVYCVLTNGNRADLHPVQNTRRIFFYGLVCMIPILPFADFSFAHFPGLLQDNVFWHLLYLSIIASAVCYITWNFSIGRLSAVKTSVYIYGMPVITVIASALILHEQITALTVAGVVLTLVGLIFSIQRPKPKKPQTETAAVEAEAVAEADAVPAADAMADAEAVPAAETSPAQTEDANAQATEPAQSRETAEKTQTPEPAQAGNAEPPAKES